MLFSLDGIIAILVASIPGILVAWFGSYLNVRENREQIRMLGRNARAQLRLEIDGNLNIVQTYQQELHALDTGHSTESQTRMKDMINRGLFQTPLPPWSVVRWEQLPAVALPQFSPTEIEAVEKLYQALAQIRALYQHVVTFSSEQERELGTTDAANLRIAGQKITVFARLEKQVALIAQTPNPLNGKK
jgi:hypothetical protein